MITGIPVVRIALLGMLSRYFLQFYFQCFWCMFLVFMSGFRLEGHRFFHNQNIYIRFW